MSPHPVALPAVMLAVAVLALGAGCSDGESDSSSATSAPSQSATATQTTTQAWADGVCSSITEWETAIDAAAATAVTSGVSKESLTTAVDDAREATEALGQDLKGLDKPGTEAGEQAKSTIDQLASDLASESATLKSATSDVSGVLETVNAAKTVATTLKTMGGQVSAAVSSIKALDGADELEAAFDQSATCQQLARPTASPTS